MVEDKSVFLEVECNAISDRVGEGENAVSRRIIPVRSHRCMPSKAPGNIEAARCLELFEWCLWQLSRGLVMRGRRGAIRGDEKVATPFEVYCPRDPAMLRMFSGSRITCQTLNVRDSLSVVSKMPIH
jgi:hypothetical protein